MKLCSIISGSSGNCVYLETEKTRILIDAGCSGRQIELLMKQAGLDPRRLNGIFVTHEHGDHIQGVGVMSRRFHIPIFANAKTWEAMARRIGRITPSYRRVFKNRERFQFQDIEVQPFLTHHDAADPVGYAFSAGSGKASVVTDTGFVDERIIDAIDGSDIYYFEANHDEEMLINGPYPELLKQRILSREGHLSNLQAGRALSEVLAGRGEIVLLAHMSIENNEPSLCLDTVQTVLQSEGIDALNAQRISVAPRLIPSAICCCTDTGSPERGTAHPGAHLCADIGWAAPEPIA